MEFRRVLFRSKGSTVMWEGKRECMVQSAASDSSERSRGEASWGVGVSDIAGLDATRREMAGDWRTGLCGEGEGEQKGGAKRTGNWTSLAKETTGWRRGQPEWRTE